MGSLNGIEAHHKHTASSNQRVYFPLGLSPQREGNRVFDSEFERSLFDLRRAKLAEIEKLGQAAYPNQLPASHTVPLVRAKWGETTAEALESDRETGWDRQLAPTSRF